MKKSLLFIIALFVFSTFVNNTNAQTMLIGTYAGTGTAGWIGDGVALNTEFNYNYGVCLDAAGNVYVADATNNRVRKITPAGIISTIGGNGTAGFGGDGGLAIAANLNYPTGVAVDAAGNVYIADALNSRVRKINNATGNISTIAGTGIPGYNGDGIAANTARLNRPFAVALDAANNVYISEGNGARIRKITVGTGVISTVAGTGVPGYNGDGIPPTIAKINNPRGIVVDAAGNIYIADMSNNRIRMVTIATGRISTIAGTGTAGFSGDLGPANTANVNTPVGVALDASNNIYIADASNNRIRMINSLGNINTIAGNGTGAFFGDGLLATSAEINTPLGVAVLPNGNYYISDANNNRVRFVYANRTPYFTGGSSQNYSVCENIVGDSINALLAITDSDKNQSETWTLLTGPSNGTANATTTGTSNGGNLITTGMYFTPNPGFSGLDTFTVQISDGYASSIDTIYVTVNPIPNPGLITSSTLSICVGSTVALTDTPAGGTWMSSDVTLATVDAFGNVLGTGQGNPTIYYSLSNACGTTAATATLNVELSATAILGSTNVCIGSSIALSDITTGGSWSSSNANVNLDAFGNVTGVTVGTTDITYSVSNACGSTFTTLTLTIGAAPATGTISGPTDVCLGSVYNYTETVSGGIWSVSNANVTISTIGDITPVAIGLDTIIYSITSACGVTDTTFVVSVDAVSTPGVTITSSLGTVGCAGLSSTFTANPTNGGSAPAYQWQVNGINTGINQTFTYIPVSGDVVTVIMTPSNPCATATAATDFITMTIIPTVLPTLHITDGALGDTLCLFQSATFTATSTNGGTSPVYQWTVNGINVSTANPFVYMPANGDLLVCKLTSNANCALPDTVLSPAHLMTVDTNETPSITISVSPDDTVCAGTVVTYIAHGHYGGTTPTYQWIKNGVYVATGPTYSCLAYNHDSVVCILSSNSPCAVVPSAISNSIKMIVQPVSPPSVTITANPGLLLTIGQNDTLTAVVTGGGTSPTYQWVVNGVLVPYATNATYVLDSVTAVKNVNCIVTGSDRCPGAEGNAYATVTPANVGVNDINTSAGEIVLVPNPNKGTFTIQGNHILNNEITIEIANVIGQVVYTDVVTINNTILNKKISIDTNLPNGIYLLHVISNNENKLIRFSLNR